MSLKKNRFWSHDNRYRLMLTLGLAVLLPAAALIYVNFRHVNSIKRDKKIEALIHRDFQYVLAVAEKKLNRKAYSMTEEVRNVFPSPDESEPDKTKKLDLILAKNPWLAHVFLYDREKGLLFRSQPQQPNDKLCREESDMMAETFRGWFGMEGKLLLEGMHKKSRPMSWYSSQTKRADGDNYITTAFFALPQVSKDRVVLGGASFEPTYLKKTFFPEVLNELITQKLTEDHDAAADTSLFDSGPAPVTMIVYPTDADGGLEEPVATSTGWSKGKPEIMRKLDDVFRGLALGIKFQGTTADAIGRRWVMQSFLILGALSLLMIGGLVLTYRSVSKEMALAHLKADFVSNVSHELRTPLALIRLYAETLELGRITTQEKKEDYYRIIRKESERLTSLINNILDFSRIEAGRKEYDFRETDIADLVRNTLDAYRYQIEQQGFAFEQNIDMSIPAVRVDREAIARALVNLVNNALKYSADEKFLGVRLYRADSLLKLEVIDRGIGITRREQSKIFEKFYRTGDPLVHNTKGSGLGLSLVRHITRAHGGEVEVESTPGKGSKFILSLPLAAAATPGH
jgi:signal transduction histidine kinase